ncbi:MAG: hypothetical protein ACRD3M_02455 [Thermoanaerobaculia bacterium]
MKLRKLVSPFMFSFLAAVAPTQAQQPTPPAPGGGRMEEKAKPGMMTEGMMDESMMARHKEMMAKMEAMDSRLDDLVKKMNAAKGSKKVDAIAAVVNELVLQRKEMRRQMMAMQPEMMRHMMQHMHMGMMKGMMESLSQCPMMTEMAGPQGEPKKPTKDGHSEHHPE